MKVAIVGTGGIGGYTGGRLAAAGHDVSFIARGANLEALRSSGLTIESPHGNARLPAVHATDDPRDVGPVDIIVFGVKLWDVDTAGPLLAPMMSPRTLAITFQNGVDTPDMLARHVPRPQIVPGAYRVSAFLARPGVIVDTGAPALMQIDDLGGDERIAAFAAAVNGTVALGCELCDSNTVDILWRKFVGLVSFAGSTALMRKPIGAIRANPETLAFLDQLTDEAMTIATALKRKLPPDTRQLIRDTFMTFPADATASMALDLANGRRLELPWLNGRVHHLGVELGIPTPAHTAVYRGLVLHEMGNR